MTITRLVKLPASVRGFTLVDEDGNYNIYINKNQATERARSAYKHEVEHILAGDFESPCAASVGLLEGMRHEGS